jgi:hypothetical protein
MEMTRHDDTVTADVRDMVVVHGAFRREFRLAPALVRGTTRNDRRRARRVGRHLGLLTDLLHHHHATEDRVLWPLLAGRVPAGTRPLVELAETQHAQIAETMGCVEAVLPHWMASASAGTREDLAVALVRLDAAVAEHLAMEEDRILPLLVRHLSAAEYARLGDEALASLPKARIPLVFGMLMYEGDPDVIATILTNAPAPVRMLMPSLAPRSYARYARKVHGTPTP